MTNIDVKFMKGNKQTLKAMETVYKEKPKETKKNVKKGSK